MATITDPVPTSKSEDTALPVNNSSFVDMSRFSSLAKLLRVTAYVLRFTDNCRGGRSTESQETLTTEELHRAENVCIRSCQMSKYQAEVKDIQTKRYKLPLSRQLKLFPNSGILKCRGRIHNAPLDEMTKYPYLLPTKHPFTNLIIKYAHSRLLHAGVSSTTTFLRQKYWIPSIRLNVKVILRKCTCCKKIVGNLIPEEILRMDKRSIELYKEVLQAGHESVHNIRVMVVGHYGVGKTTLTKRLFKEDININKQESTNGIDVHIRKCKVSLENGDWKMLDTGQKTIHNRLVKLLTKKILDKENPEEEAVPISTEVKCTGSDNTIHQGQKRTHYRKVLETDSWDAPNVSKIPTSSTLDPTEDYFRNQLLDLIKEQSLLSDDRDATTADLSVWDFAGQYAFYATHQVFLSRRAVYLLVTDMSKHMEDIVQDDDCFPDSDGAKNWRISEFVELWLKSIHEFCSSSDDQGPPVLLVGTFADKLNQEKREDMIDEFFYTLRKSLVDKATNCHLTDEDFAIDNSIVDGNIEKLRQHIFKVASRQSYWGELIPARWVTLENSIDNLKDKGEKVLRKSEFLDLNNRLPVPLETEEELELFLRFHHETGNILYYREEKLNDTIVLDPQWLIDAFKSLITARMFCCRKPTILKKWIEFDQSAILTHGLIDAVWSKEDNSIFHEHKDLLLNYLDRLGLIAKPHEESVTDYYFAPCVLKTCPTADLLSCLDCENQKPTSKLCFTTTSGFLPTAVFNKLLAAFISKWTLSKINGKRLIFCGFGVFDLENNHSLYAHFFDNVIQIWITKLSIIDEPSTDLCSEVKAFVTEFIQDKYRCSSDIKTFLRCKYAEVRSSENGFGLDEIFDKEEVVCKCRASQHVLRTEELTKYWFFDVSPDMHLDNARELNEKELSTIAQAIGDGWQLLGSELGLTAVEMEHISADNKKVVMQVYQMLLKWRSKNENEATVGRLHKAMKRCRKVTFDWAVIESVLA
ncbi:uncharacterized protein LOC128554881 [Mercenaria mercenaria]|uniref:uncharacterized protein LOC128554881 n=1 Tax=Mercenaria mercenaria TaxID=6596 RepID=UPI00234E740C|nr:uncharacterized protein LOC128554881 [Mercenaria mercenaria]